MDSPERRPGEVSSQNSPATDRDHMYRSFEAHQHSVDSSDALHHCLHPDNAYCSVQPTLALQTSLTNDSFGHPLGSHAVFGSTRPFDNGQGSSTVEQFLSAAPAASHAFTPNTSNQNSGAIDESRHVSKPSNIVSISKGDTSASSPLGTSLWSKTTVAPIVTPAPWQAASSAASTSSRKTSAPLPVASVVHRDPELVSTATFASLAGSVPIVASFSSSTASSRPPLPRSPSRRSPTARFPLTSSVVASAAGSSTLPAISARPVSPVFSSVGHQGSSLLSHSHACEVAPGGAGADPGSVRSYSPLQRSPASPDFSLTLRRPHSGSGMPFSPTLILSPGGVGGGFPRSRTDAELRRFFSEREGTNISPTNTNSAGQVLRGGSPGSIDRHLPYIATSSPSVGSRQRAVIRASESSFDSGGLHNSSRCTSYGVGGGVSSSGAAPVQPRWMSAVERIKESRNGEGFSMCDPVLPYDQSKLGMQARRIAAQGMLTAGKLHALEVQQAGGRFGGTDRGYPQQPVAQSISGSSARPSPYSTRYPSTSGNTPVSMAYDKGFSASPQHYGRTPSEQLTWRRGGYVRSVAGGSQSMGGGRQAVTASPTLRVITTSETVTGGGVGNTSMNNTSGSASFRTRAASGGILSSPGSVDSKPSVAEQKLSNFFQGKSQQTINKSLYAMESSSGGVAESSAWSGGAAVSLCGTVNHKGAAGGGGGGGGGGGSSGSPSSKGGPRKMVKVPHSDDEKNRGYKWEDPKKKMVTEGDDDEQDERNSRTRNIDALHAIPWDQRQQLPVSGFGTRFFALLNTPRFWEKLDWTVRASLLTVLPTMVLSLEPSTSPMFPLPSSLAFNAFWITMPTFGSGLRELMIALKGFSFGLLFLCIIVGTHPGPSWESLLLLFFFTLISSFVAEETKKTAAYVLASTIMQYIVDPVGTNFDYIRQYYIGLLIGLAFGTAGFLVPFIRWSSDIARHYIKAMGNSLSIDLQGTLSSFWVRTPLERELNVVRLRQLRATAEKCLSKIETALEESGYEPHTGAYMMCMVNRFNFCKSIHNILGSLSHVIELIADNPSLIDTPMCTTFGEQIGDDLAVISSAMDSMVLKIVDFARIVTPQEIQFFREARQRFQDALSRVREDVILTNENYETDESDVLLGFFMFSVDEMCEVISQFEETAHPPNTLWNAMLFPVRDVKSVIAAFRNLGITVVRRRTIPRRMKEAIKLSLCIVLPCIFQVYALDNDSVSPAAGAAVIALIYNPTGSESFHYASGRLLGTVLGSLGALLSVQVASSRLWVLYIFITILSFIGAYVQSAPGFYALGNAIVSSTISVCTQYQNGNAAMVRIQQNCFAILMYFAIACTLWPMHARTKVRMSLNITLRCMREAITRMLRNLDMPYDANEVTADVSALLIEMHKKVRTQSRFIPGAVEEPTMGSVEYPEDSWKRIVEAEKKLCLALSMMCFAYNTFMSGRADSTTELSVHWVVLHRIAPHAQDLSDLIYASIDLYLLSLSKMTIVPTSHITRLRVGMVDAHQAILETYMATISRKVAGEQDVGEEGKEEDMYGSNSYMNDEEYYDYGGSPHLPPTREARSYMKNINGDGGSAAGVDDKPSGRDGDHPAPPQQRPQRQQSEYDHGHDRGNHSSGDSTDSSSSENAECDGNGNKRPHKRTAKGDDGKKKVGYLSYELTAEEAAALRAFVANRVSNATFGSRKSMMVNNATFSGQPASGVSAAATAAAAAVLGARGSITMSGSLPHGNNDARLMAVTGNDDGLAASLRKKHKVMVKRGKGEENDGDVEGPPGSEGSHDEEKAKGGRSDADNAPGTFLSNASFLNSSFRNASLLGNLFARKTKGPRDLDTVEMQQLRAGRSRGSRSTSSNSKGEFKKKKRQQRRSSKRWEESDGDGSGESTSQHSTPLTLPTHHSHLGIVGSDFSDIEDDPKPLLRRRLSTKVLRLSETGVDPKDAKVDECLPMVHSVPVELPGGNGSVLNPLAEDSGACEGAAGAEGNPLPMPQPPSMASGRDSAAELVAVHRNVDSAGTSLQQASNLTAEQLCTVAEATSGTLFSGDDPAMAAASLNNSGGAATIVAHDLSQFPRLPQCSNNVTPEDHKDSPPRTCSGAEEGKKKCEDRDRTRHISSNEKAVPDRDGEETAHNRTGENQPHGRSDDTPGKDGRAPGKTGENQKDASGAVVRDDQLLNNNTTTHRSLATLVMHPPSEMGRGSLDSEGNCQRAALMLNSTCDGDGTSVTPSEDGEILNNLFFFDADKGEFVLTNHDIHSLEAFLFGTRALIVYINDMQKALLEMQHATDLARWL